MSMRSNEDDSAPREILERLRRPVEDVDSLLDLLCSPLQALGILPAQYRRYARTTLRAGSIVVARHVPPIQIALLEHVLPAWESELSRQSLLSLADLFFCAEDVSTSDVHGKIALLAYTSLLSVPIDTHSIRYLTRLQETFPVERVHDVIFGGPAPYDSKCQLAWEDCISTLASVPAKVANAGAMRKLAIPRCLDHGFFFDSLCIGHEKLVNRHCESHTQGQTASLAFMLSKLYRLGAFPAATPNLPSQPSYFKANLPIIRDRSMPAYATFWSTLLTSLGLTMTVQAIMTSLLGHLLLPSLPLDTSTDTRAFVKREALLLCRLSGGPGAAVQELLDSLYAVALSKEWSEGHARIVACRAYVTHEDLGNEDEALLTRVVELWSSPTHVKHSLLSRHRYVTALFLLTLSNLKASTFAEALAFDPTFVTGVSAYIGHVDPAVRRCGMLVAEVVAARAGKQLDFGDWDGDDGGKAWARSMRQLIEQRDAEVTLALQDDAEEEPVKPAAPLDRDIDSDDELYPPPSRAGATIAAGYDSDDSLTGYASSPGSSRASSPTSSELAEIEKDPTLIVGKKKVPRPVYLAQLGDLVRPTTVARENEETEPDRVAVALDVAEELIRRKRDYGTELEENAVNLVHGFVGLQDNFALDGFAENRQATLIALVVCCPQKSTPSMVEEFFKNQYSMDQRFAVLNAIALGARELASLPVPPSKVPAARVSFPSKRLPPALDRKYITATDHLNAPVQHLLEDISRQAATGVHGPPDDQAPQLARERHLRLRQPPKVVDVTSSVPPSLNSLLRTAPVHKMPTTFTTVAAEYFIHPLLSRFWLFLRDEQAREDRSAHLPSAHRYRGAGTGLILSPPVLSHLLATLAVLMHAGRNAPAWPAVLAPDALELALVLGSRPVSLLDAEEEHPGANADAPSNTAAMGARDTHASVLGAALELALAILAGAADTDGGRTLALEHTPLLLGVGEWAGKVLSMLERGERAKGGGGAREARLGAASAGVLLKVEEIAGRWRRSMSQIT